MSPTLTTFVFELVNFLVLVGLVGWILFTPVRAMVRTRAAADKERADTLAARMASAEHALAELRKREASFEDDMARARATRLAAAEQEATSIVAKAREAASGERERSTKALGHMEHAEFERLVDAVVGTSRQVVERLLVSLGTPGLAPTLLQTACRQICTIEADSLGAVLVESAAPLDTTERELVAAALGTRATSSAFRVVPELGAGVRITTAVGVIDLSTAGMATETERMLKEALMAGDSRSAA